MRLLSRAAAIVTFNLLTVCFANLEICSNEIEQAIEVILQNSTSMRIPFGRAYLAATYGQALFHDPLCSQLQHRQYCVRTCSLSRKLSHSSSREYQPLECASLSLHGFLVGQEVAPAEYIYLNTSKSNDHRTSCVWIFKFPDMLRSGAYSLQIWTHSMNEFEDPSAADLENKNKEERHNQGKSIALSGLGSRQFNDVISFSEYDFTGHAIMKRRSNALYLARDRGNLSQLCDMETFYLLNLRGRPVFSLIEQFFYETFVVLPLEINVTNYVTVPTIIPTNLTKHMHLPTFETFMFTYGDYSWQQSLIFGLSFPEKNVDLATTETWILRAMRQTFRFYSSHIQDTTLLSQGRWVHYHACEEWLPYNSKQQLAYYNSLPAGHICHQTRPVFAGEVTLRYRGLVWQPWEIDIIQMDISPISLPEFVVPFLSSSLFCNIVASMQWNNTNYHASLSFSSAASNFVANMLTSYHNISSSFVDGSFAKVVTLPSPLTLCLRSSGIGFIAGFGDSLGVEQVENVKHLLGNRLTWSPEGHGIVCTGSGTAHIHFVGRNDLARCIEQELIYLLKSRPRISLFDSEFNSSIGVPVTSIVLVTNFMAQHATGGMPLANCEAALRNQAHTHKELAEKLLMEHNITYRRIFMSGVSIHGFKKLGLTNARQEWFNSKAKEILVNEGGFEIFDTFNITSARPDGTRDGTHYKGGVSRALTDVLSNIVCLHSCG